MQPITKEESEALLGKIESLKSKYPKEFAYLWSKSGNIGNIKL